MDYWQGNNKNDEQDQHHIHEGRHVDFGHQGIVTLIA
jgi:hypothetical protein